MTNHDPPNEKCDVAEFGDRTTSHPVSATTETKSKDHNMTDNITTDPTEATLTQKELFQRFLDAKVRIVPRSTLIPTPYSSDRTMSEHFLDHIGCVSVCFPHGSVDQMINALRECDDPMSELLYVLDDLEGFLFATHMLSREFSDLRGATPTEQPNKDASEQKVREVKLNLTATTPREKLLNGTANRLNALLDHYGAYNPKSKRVNEDTKSLAKAIMREFERCALGKEGDRLIFCDPDMPVDFIEA